MTDWVQKQHEKRCEGKIAFRRASRADIAAQKMTHKKKDLFVSYQCCDCGLWHIGHADQSQLQARVPASMPRCEICRKKIPEERLTKSIISDSPTRTCSNGCATEAHRRRKLQRKLMALTATELTSYVVIAEDSSITIPETITNLLKWRPGTRLALTPQPDHSVRIDWAPDPVSQGV
jgi:hypothetical protein